jgi:hypothetical protein
MFRSLVATAVLAGLCLGIAAHADAQTPAPRVLQLSFSADGLVTLSAQHVTVREILAEWARQCGCVIVNADRLSGAPVPVPLSFTAAPQPDVLRSLLRDTAGYALTPRRPDSTAVSQFETIYIINAAGPVAYTPAATPVTPVVIRGAPDDEIPPVVPIVIGQEPPVEAPAGEAPNQPAPPPQPPTPAGGFVITPVSPVSPAPPAQAPGQPATQPGRVTPAPQQP